MLHLKHRWLISVVIVLLFIDSSPAQRLAKSKEDTASVDRACEPAKSQLELNQCSGEQYRKADDRLNAVYRKALDFMRKDLSDARQHGDADEEKYNQPLSRS